MFVVGPLKNPICTIVFRISYLLKLGNDIDLVVSNWKQCLHALIVIMFTLYIRTLILMQ